MGPREHTSVTVEIAPRSAYFAKSCPQRVQLDVLRPCEPLPDSPFVQKLIETGHEYEDETVTGLFAGVEGAVLVDAEDPDAREWHTRRALEAGAPLVAGGRLPVDHEAHRVGEPDVLVRDGAGYLPVDVKSHKSLVAAKRAGRGSALVSELDRPFPGCAATEPDHDRRQHVGDQLQLAHYRRLLETAGFASPAGNVAGICGSEGVIVWYDLDEAWLPAPEYVAAAPAGPLSAMARYDLEFAHRLEVLVAAEAYAEDAAAQLLAEPIACEQCDHCRWRDFCGERLQESADLSLLAGVGVARRRLYRSHGVADLHDLAALDWAAAELSRRVDLGDLRAKAAGHPGATPLASVVPRRTAQLEVLAGHGVVTVADAAALNARTLELCAAGATNLAGQIELARARVGPAPAYRRRGVARLEVPRGDVEVDVDMESTAAGCYLWGALVTDRRAGAPEPRYVACATWDPDLEAGELEAFGAFWAWFADARARARAEGADFRAYCYAKGAEEGQMKRLAARLGLDEDVGAFLTSEDWVDLYEVVRRQLVTGRSLGLKETAPLAGFAWTAEEAGGTQAMVTYDAAVDEDADASARAEAQEWILRYNEDDVRATATLRDWLDGPARDLPSIAAAHPA